MACILVLPGAVIFLRTLRDGERGPWLDCLTDSLELYQQNVQLLGAALSGPRGPSDLSELGVTRQSLQLGLGPGVAGGAAAALGVGVGMGGAAGAALTYVDLDGDQRRRARARVNDRMAEIAPLAGEVERVVGSLAGQLSNVLSGKIWLLLLLICMYAVVECNMTVLVPGSACHVWNFNAQQLHAGPACCLEECRVLWPAQLFAFLHVSLCRSVPECGWR